MTLDQLIIELSEQHTAYFNSHGHNIPTSVLSFSASEYLDVISKARSARDAYENFEKINTANVLWKDFVDPKGEDQMSRFIRSIKK